MALTDVRPYFRTHLNALSLKEHPDGFNVENIASTILDNSYHLEIGTIATSASNQRDHIFAMPIKVRVFLKGYRDPANEIDAAIALSENIMAEVLKPSNRYGTDIKDIIPVSIVPTPLDESNDNSVILEMDFTANVILCFD